MIRSWTGWFIALFASPLGVPVLAALDSTLFFSLPFGIDTAVILLAACTVVFRLHIDDPADVDVDLQEVSPGKDFRHVRGARRYITCDVRACRQRADR